MAVSPDIRILVVDDFLPIRKAIIETLKLLKFNNVEDAENGIVALEKMEAEKFDLVISDWVMPEMDGLELLTNIKSNEKLKSVPVMMVTAEAAPENIVKAIKAGAANYIVKPITVKTLSTKIQKIFDAAS